MKNSQQSARRPHDRSQRLLFHHRRPVRDLIRGFVKEPWVQDLDFRTLQRQPSDFLSGMMPGDYEERTSDVLWKLRWKKRSHRTDGDVYVLILLEFQSKCRQDVALRVLTYMLLFYSRIQKENSLKKGDKVPVIVPLILYNGNERWWAPTDVFDLVEEAPASFAPHIPSMKCIVIDEKRCPPGDLLELDENVAAAIIRAEQAMTGPDLGAVVQDLAQWLKAPDYQELCRDLVAWFAKVVVPTRFPEAEIPEIRGLVSLINFMETGMPNWIEQAEARGRQEGTAGVILRLIEGQYGSIPENIRERVLAAEIEDLQVWTDRILRAQTLEDIFQDSAVAPS